MASSQPYERKMFPEKRTQKYITNQNRGAFIQKWIIV